MGLGLLIILSTVIFLATASFSAFSGNGNSSSLVPNFMGTGMNLLYFVSSSVILESSKNSFESLSMWRIISVPLSFFLDFFKVKFGDPSQDQCAASSPL